jgi:hypothetical protein
MDALHHPLHTAPEANKRIIDVTQDAREEHFLVAVALTAATYRRCVQLAGAPESTTNFFNLCLLLEALRTAIEALSDEEPPALFFTFTIPDEAQPLLLCCICEPSLVEGFLIGLYADNLERWKGAEVRRGEGSAAPGTPAPARTGPPPSTR